jgi:hypothetical protein
MNNLLMYCLSLNNDDLDNIKLLDYIPVGLGQKKFSNEWVRDNTGENISKKNNFYGEYTFHYWFWKNKLDEIDSKTWVGFCAYRRFWTNNKNNYSITNKECFLKKIQNDWNNYDVILGQNIYMDGWTKMKIIKHGLKSFLLNPKYFLKKNQNLKLHFDSYHGYGNLEKAIKLLDENDRVDFELFMKNQNFYNRGNMFIIRNKNILRNFYNTIFPWLIRCEKIFGFKLTDYGNTRIYGFLMERFVSYWFNKYARVKIWPISFYNINKEKLI